MFVEFVVENHLSFRDQSRFRMAASPIKDLNDKGVFTSKYNDLRVLNSAALYGGNASGKSNWIHSFACMKEMVLQSPSAYGNDQCINVSPFRLEVNKVGLPSMFEIQIVIKDQLVRYGFEVDRLKVHSEWFFVTNKRKESEQFIRVGNEFRFSPSFKRDFPVADVLKQLISPSRLFLSTLGQFNVPLIIDIIKWFAGIKFFFGRVTNEDLNRFAKILEDPRIGGFVKRLFKDLDLGFTRLKPQLSKLYQAASQAGDHKVANRKFIDLMDVHDDSYVIKTMHDVFDSTGTKVNEVEFDLIRDESIGSQKIVAIAGPIVETLLHGGLIIMDELDASLHPGVIRSILTWFNSTHSNPSNAQLIAALHNPNILDHKLKLLRRDQQVFFEKDKFGASSFKTAYERDIRSDASFQNEYLDGKIVKGPAIGGQLSLF